MDQQSQSNSQTPGDSNRIPQTTPTRTSYLRSLYDGRQPPSLPHLYPPQYNSRQESSQNTIEPINNNYARAVMPNLQPRSQMNNPMRHQGNESNMMQEAATLYRRTLGRNNSVASPYQQPELNRYGNPFMGSATRDLPWAETSPGQFPCPPLSLLRRYQNSPPPLMLQQSVLDSYRFNNTATEDYTATDSSDFSTRHAALFSQDQRTATFGTAQAACVSPSNNDRANVRRTTMSGLLPPFETLNTPCPQGSVTDIYVSDPQMPTMDNINQSEGFPVSMSDQPNIYPPTESRHRSEDSRSGGIVYNQENRFTPKIQIYVRPVSDTHTSDLMPRRSQTMPFTTVSSNDNNMGMMENENSAQASGIWYTDGTLVQDNSNLRSLLRSPPSELISSPTNTPANRSAQTPLTATTQALLYSNSSVNSRPTAPSTSQSCRLPPFSTFQQSTLNSCQNTWNTSHQSTSNTEPTTQNNLLFSPNANKETDTLSTINLDDIICPGTSYTDAPPVVIRRSIATQTNSDEYDSGHARVQNNGVLNGAINRSLNLNATQLSASRGPNLYLSEIYFLPQRSNVEGASKQAKRKTAKINKKRNTKNSKGNSRQNVTVTSCPIPPNRNVPPVANQQRIQIPCTCVICRSANEIPSSERPQDQGNKPSTSITRENPTITSTLTYASQVPQNAKNAFKSTKKSSVMKKNTATQNKITETVTSSQVTPPGPVTPESTTSMPQVSAETTSILARALQQAFTRGMKPVSPKTTPPQKIHTAPSKKRSRGKGAKGARVQKKTYALEGCKHKVQKQPSLSTNEYRNLGLLQTGPYHSRGKLCDNLPASSPTMMARQGGRVPYFTNFMNNRPGGVPMVSILARRNVQQGVGSQRIPYPPVPPYQGRSRPSNHRPLSAPVMVSTAVSAPRFADDRRRPSQLQLLAQESAGSHNRRPAMNMGPDSRAAHSQQHVSIQFPEVPGIVSPPSPGSIVSD